MKAKGKSKKAKLRKVFTFYLLPFALFFSASPRLRGEILGEQ
jgi:hypothetical protein